MYSGEGKKKSSTDYSKGVVASGKQGHEVNVGSDLCVWGSFLYLVNLLKYDSAIIFSQLTRYKQCTSALLPGDFNSGKR